MFFKVQNLQTRLGFLFLKQLFFFETDEGYFPLIKMLMECWRVFSIFNIINCRAIFVIFELFFYVPFIF